MKYAKDVTADVLRYRLRRMGFGRARRARRLRHRRAPTSSSRPSTPRTACCSTGSPRVPAGPGPRRRLLRRPVRRPASARTGHRVTGVDLVKHEGVAERRRRRSSRPTSTTACPPRSATTTTWSSPATSSSTSSTRSRCCATSPTGSPPAARSSSRCPNFGHWYPRGTRGRCGRFDYDQRGPLDHGHVRFFTRRTLRAAGRRTAACGSSSGDGRLPVRRPGPRRRRRHAGRVAARVAAASTAPRPGLADHVRLPVPLPAGASLTPDPRVVAGDDRPTGASDDSRRRVATASPGVLVGGAAYFLTLLELRHRPRPHRASRLGYASNFFDLQARAFLDGRICRARAARSASRASSSTAASTCTSRRSRRCCGSRCSFTTDEFDGRLTLLSMALAFVLIAVMTGQAGVAGARPAVRRASRSPGCEAVSPAIFLALATGGTTLTFDAAAPVGLPRGLRCGRSASWSAAMYWMLRVLPASRPGAASAGSPASPLAAILTRTTGGWAVCLVPLVIGLWLLSRARRSTGPRRTGWWVVAGGRWRRWPSAIAYNWVKFGHPYLFPLQDQVWTPLNAAPAERARGQRRHHHRPAVLHHLVHGVLPARRHPVRRLLPVDHPARREPATGLRRRLRRPELPHRQRHRVHAAAAAADVARALPVLFRPSAPTRPAGWLRAPPGRSGVLVTAGVMAYGYLANRYTSEFVPALVLGAAISHGALVDPAGAAASAAARRRAVVPCWRSAVVLASPRRWRSASPTAAYHRGGPLLRGSSGSRTGSAAGAQAGLISRVGRPARPAGTTDDLDIRGDCDALYLNTGDTYEPWVLGRASAASSWARPSPATPAPHATSTRPDRDRRPGTRLAVHQTSAVARARLVHPTATTGV